MSSGSRVAVVCIVLSVFSTWPVCDAGKLVTGDDGGSSYLDCSHPRTAPWYTACQAGLPPSERWIYAKQGRFIQVNGLWMHYVDIGKDAPGALDRVYVFLHGQPTWGYMWRNIIKVVAGCRNDDFPDLPNACDGPDLPGPARAIAKDYVGFGRSEKPPIEFDSKGVTRFNYSISSHVDQLEGFLDALRLGEENGGPKVIVVAHDWGGGIGLGYLGRRPRNVAGYACFDCIMFDIPYSALTTTPNSAINDPIREVGAFAEVDGGFNTFIDRFGTVQSYRSIFAEDLFMRAILRSFIIPGNLSEAEFAFDRYYRTALFLRRYLWTLTAVPKSVIISIWESPLRERPPEIRGAFLPPAGNIRWHVMEAVNGQSNFM